jgi:hypothetical protein
MKKEKSESKKIFYGFTAILACYLITCFAFTTFILVHFSNAEKLSIRQSSIIGPTNTHLTDLQVNINQVLVNLQAYLAMDEPYNKHIADSLLKINIPNSIEKLGQLSEVLEDREMILRIEAINQQFSRIKKSYDKVVHSADPSHNLLRNDIIPSVKKWNQSIKEVYLILQSRHQNQFVTIQSDIGTYKIFFPLLAFLLTGGFFVLIYYKGKSIITTITTIEKPLSKAAAGDIGKNLSLLKNEFDPIVNNINALLESLRNLKTFAQEVGNGNFNTDIAVFNNNGELGHSLASMRESLQKVSAEDKKRDWTNVGLTKFGDIIRNNNQNIKELSYQIISQLIKYLNANQGGIFILGENENGDRILELAACYAYNKKKFVERQVEIGQGLIGQAFLEKESIYLKEIPEDYIHITSGLGEATPRTILLQPMVFNEEVFGVIEIASFNDFEQYQLDLIEKISELAASAISTVKINERTKSILAESQQMTEMLRSQEEELRQNTEELQATQEEMQRRIRELEEENQNLQNIISQKQEPA